jgi:hypothetical protein
VKIEVTAEALWGEKAGEPGGLYRKPERQGFPASEAPGVQRFQSIPTFPRPAYRCATRGGWWGDTKAQRSDSTPFISSTTSAFGMASLPDENLIELLLHLKVRTHTCPYSAFASDVALENHSRAGEDDPELPASSFVRAHGSDGQD